MVSLFLESGSNLELARVMPPLMPPLNGVPRCLAAGTTISLVVPCYNEEAVLPLLFSRITKAAAVWGGDYEVLPIDDGSVDRTWEILSELHDRDRRWKAIRLARNFGQQSALWAGLQCATGDVIVILDADLQDPPEVLPQFFAKWVEGYDVVYAVRRNRKEGVFKRLAYFLYYRVLAYLSEIDIPLDSGDFCVMDRRVLQAVLATREQVPFIRGLRAPFLIAPCMMTGGCPSGRPRSIPSN